MSDLFHAVLPHLVGFCIGLVIGLERERAHPPGSQAMGIRTLALFGLLGTVAGTTDSEPLEYALTAFVAGTVLIGYYRSARGGKSDIGLTTEAAAIGVFALGHLSIEDAGLSAILGALMLAVLASRKAIHRFSRELLRPDELHALVSISVLALGVLPLLPDRTFGPLGMFNPFRFVALLVALASIQFLSHASLRVFGRRMGPPLAGLLAGFVSSTAAFLSIRKDKDSPGHVAYGAAASVAMTLQFAAIVAANAPALFRTLLPGITAAILVFGAAVWLGSRASSKGAPGSGDRLSHPLDWKSLLVQAGVLFAILSLTTLAVGSLGNKGLWLATFLSGLFELHGITFAITNSAADAEAALTALNLAFVAALVSKVALLMATPRPWKNRSRAVLTAALFAAGLLFVVGARSGLLE